MDQVIPRLAGDIVSGRAKQDILLQAFWRCASKCLQKIKKHHASAGENSPSYNFPVCLV
jgi:hypothetical protein